MVIHYLLGVDIGTYSTKGLIVDPSNGHVIGSHSIEHGLSMLKPGFVEQDADAIWYNEFAQICRKLIAESGIDPREIKGVGVSGIGNCALPIDENGKPLRPGILYGIDTRATAEIAELEAKFGREKIFKLAGTHLSSSAIGPKILWVKHNESEIYAKTRWWLNSHSYIVYRLTKHATIDIYSSGGYAPMLDIEKIRWNEEMANIIAPLATMPDLLWSSDIAGEVASEAAIETGLAEGTPVITGTIDAAAEAISAGLTDVGDMMLMFGSSNSLILRTDRLFRTQNFWGLNWTEPDTYAIVGGMSTAGSLTRWFRDNFAQQEITAQKNGGVNAYTELVKLAGDSPPGANGLITLPYFNGERTPIYNPDARGVLFGLTLKHTRADIYRSLLESVGFGIRHNVEVLIAENAIPKRILGVGGGTKNLEWMQIICDIANIGLDIPKQQTGSPYGVAFMAGIGTILVSGWEEIKNWIGDTIKLHPNPKNTEVYEPYYQIYRSLYEQTKSVMTDLSDIRRKEI
jgi:xylulokinase